MFQVPTILFVGSSNLHWSRFAEALFNHRAQERGLGWCACSRALDTSSAGEEGLPTGLREALDARDIPHHHTASTTNRLLEEDLAMAYLIIALCRHEHEPVVARQFPEWSGQFNFWEIEGPPVDVDLEPTYAAIEDEVEELLAAIAEAGQEP